MICLKNRRGQSKENKKGKIKYKTITLNMSLQNILKIYFAPCTGCYQVFMDASFKIIASFKIKIAQQ